MHSFSPVFSAIGVNSLWTVCANTVVSSVGVSVNKPGGFSQPVFAAVRFVENTDLSTNLFATFPKFYSPFVHNENSPLTSLKSDFSTILHRTTTAISFYLNNSFNNNDLGGFVGGKR